MSTILETDPASPPTDAALVALAEAIQLRTILRNRVLSARRLGSRVLIEAAEQQFRDQSRAVAAIAAARAAATLIPEEIP